MTDKEDNINRLEEALRVAFQKRGDQQLPDNWKDRLFANLSETGGAPPPPASTTPAPNQDFDGDFLRLSLAIGLCTFLSTLYFCLEMTEIEVYLVRLLY